MEENYTYQDKDLPKALLEIEREIDSEKIRVVSFDMFDTLVVRPMLRPEGVFKLVGERCHFEGDYTSIRKVAEMRARKNRDSLCDDVTLDEIYEELANIAPADSDIVNSLKREELNIERELLKPRTGGRILYEYALSCGKEVIITTDMYLPRNFVEEVLLKNHFKEYSSLYISSEQKLAKGTGRLFERIITDYSIKGIKPDEILHVGDNGNADVRVPERFGIKSCILPNCESVMRSKRPLQLLHDMSLRAESNNTYITGTLANWMFEDLRPHNLDSISGGDPRVLGAVLYGPLLVLYTKWLIESCINNHIEVVFLVQRDGYLLNQLFELFDSIYKTGIIRRKLYLSRALREPFFSDEPNGLIHSLTEYKTSEDMSVRQFAAKRIYAETDDEIDEVWTVFNKYGYVSIDDPVGKIDKYIYFLNELEPFYRRNTERIKGTIKEYLDNTIPKGKKIAIVDVGYRGSVGVFLKDKLGVCTDTFQIFSHSSLNEGMKRRYHIHSFVEYSLISVDATRRLLHALTEDTISVQEGTAVAVIKDDQRFRIIKGDTCSSQIITSMQHGVVSYAQYLLDSLQGFFCDIQFEKNLYFEFLLQNLSHPKRMDADLLKEIFFVDSGFITNNRNNLYVDWYNTKFHTNVKSNAGNNVKTGELQPWERISHAHLFAIKLCERFHILPQAIALKKFLKDPRKKRTSNETKERIFANPCNEFMEKASKLLIKRSNERILIAGSMASFDKGTCRYINMLAKKMPSQMVVLSEANPNGTARKFDTESMVVPGFLIKEHYDRYTGVKCEKSIKKHINETSYLKEAVENLTKRHEDMEKDYAYLMVYYSEKFCEELLQRTMPRLLVLWNEFFAFHHILKNVAKKQGIPVCFMEFGVIPGTFSIDRMGIMGNSFPAICAEKFKGYEVDKADFENAKKVVDYCKRSGLNRNKQPANNMIETIRVKIKPGRPIIFYAGVNDYESGLYPYTKETEEHHSPFLKSSMEGVYLLSDIAKRNDWNLIYKPHPRIVAFKKDFHYPPNVIVVDNVDVNAIIDFSDVVVTILSALAYSSLIREKPLVMLGYTQLREKGCCYEAFDKLSVEPTIRKALDDGYTSEQKNNFIVHVAQLLKYDLFDDLNVKEFSYGQPIEKAVEYLNGMME